MFCDIQNFTSTLKKLNFLSSSLLMILSQQLLLKYFDMTSCTSAVVRLLNCLAGLSTSLNHRWLLHIIAILIGDLWNYTDKSRFYRRFHTVVYTIKSPCFRFCLFEHANTPISLYLCQNLCAIKKAQNKNKETKEHFLVNRNSIMIWVDRFDVIYRAICVLSRSYGFLISTFHQFQFLIRYPSFENCEYCIDSW